MEKFTKLVVLMIFAVLAAQVVSAWENESDSQDDDPLASAPVIDYHMPPIEEPDEAPTPEVYYGDDDIDFHGFKTRSEVLEFLKNCDKIGNVDMDCGIDFHAAVFFTDMKPKNECCQKIVKPGKLCYDLLVKFIYRNEGIKYDWNEVWRRSENVWKHCSLVNDF